MNANVLDRSDAAEISRTEVRLPQRRDMLRLRLQVALMIIDGLALAIGMSLGYTLWLPNAYIVNVIAALIAVYLVSGVNGGAFATEILSRRRASVTRALRTVVLACAGLILAAFFLKAGEHISRVTLLIGCALGIVLLVAARAAFHAWIHRRYGSQLHSEVLVIDGVACEAPPGVFVLDAHEAGLRCDMRDPLMLDRIGRLLKPADRVVIACPAERKRNWAMVLKGANIHGEIVSSELTALGPLGTARFGGGSTIVVATGSLTLRQRIAKRGMDMGLAIIALLALAPLLLIVMLAIRLDSAGSVFFIQDRVGRGNRLFGIYKFRSMRAEKCDSAGHRSASRDDDRITRVGRLIRATSIDELPQLFNILKGDMSFVGPRPHALGSLAGDLLFWEVDERYWHRHACKPGLTGLAQVRGFRGATHKESDLTNRLQADLEYIAGWTIWRDVSILLATLRVVIHRNAY